MNDFNSREQAPAYPFIFLIFRNNSEQIPFADFSGNKHQTLDGEAAMEGTAGTRRSAGIVG